MYKCSDFKLQVPFYSSHVYEKGEDENIRNITQCSINPFSRVRHLFEEALKWFMCKEEKALCWPSFLQLFLWNAYV